MKSNSVAQSLLVVAGIVFAVQAPAQEAKKQPAPSAEEKAMMDKMMQAGVPGAAHKKLEPLAGRFKIRTRAWMDPAQPPEESTGTSERKWIMGNRYLQENFQGSYRGQPFTGLGTMGYDNVVGKYFGTWIDSMSTSTTTARGALDGNVLKYEGTMSDPMSGKEAPYTMLYTIAGHDSHTMEMWGPGPDGKNVKWMETTYTRVK
ncbi:DUF1579 domain-containing protein [Massilia niastensis]|uniref:DUF1579 domain-containing protein n=1 Tax=Massilia niastensis TaxID=544911 RepID=UPI00035F22AD|nr:DUF1579 domain-containing protein [Massilia niastensis]